MAKKVRRARRPRPSEEKDIAPAEPEMTDEERLREAYAYVLKDLRRVFILAVAMFALLILLNLILQ
jgi:hypothetical protein